MSATENKIEEKEIPSATEEKMPKPSKIAIYISLLSIFLLLGSAFIGFIFYKESQSLAASQQQQLSLLNEKLSAQSSEQTELLRQSKNLKSSLDAKMSKTTALLQKANNDNRIVQTDIQSLQRSFSETNIRHPNDWILAEVEYLISLAGRKIWLEKDIKTAIALLVAADQRVVELNDASLSPLRGALLEDINSLEALPKRDPDGVILALSSLERRINKLVSTRLEASDIGKSSDVDLSSDISEWDTNLLKSWGAFVDSFITVNKRDSKIEALLSPEQAWFLQENLRNNLAKAEFAIYREQQDVYDLALENALALLTHYYDLNDNATEHFHKSLQRLSKRQISIKYPEQLSSTPVLDRVIEQRLNKSLASSNLK